MKKSINSEFRLLLCCTHALNGPKPNLNPEAATVSLVASDFKPPQVLEVRFGDSSCDPGACSQLDRVGTKNANLTYASLKNLKPIS